MLVRNPGAYFCFAVPGSYGGHLPEEITWLHETAADWLAVVACVVIFHCAVPSPAAVWAVKGPLERARSRGLGGRLVDLFWLIARSYTRTGSRSVEALFYGD